MEYGAAPAQQNRACYNCEFLHLSLSVDRDAACGPLKNYASALTAILG